MSGAEDLMEVLDPPGSCLYHYTRLETVVEQILPTGRMKMNPFSKMRDPRESKALSVVGAVDPPGSATREAIVRFAEIRRKAFGIKNEVKLLSFTVDDLTDRDPEIEIFGRGFAHPRLWERYAQGHRGICLCFDKKRLTETLMVELGKHGQPEHGAVTYRDGPIEPTAYTFSLAEIDSYSDEEIIDRMLRAGTQELFFTKTKDWETEVEYRFVVPTSGLEPLLVDVHDALRAVILGEDRANEHYKPSIRLLLEKPRFSGLGVRMRRVLWVDGVPQLQDPLAAGFS